MYHSDDSSCVGCDGHKNSGKVLDICDECDGDGTRCLGCDGLPFSDKSYDVCDVCDGDGTSCLGCDGMPKSGKVVDACGICGGNGSSCVGCDGTVASGKMHDACGVCDGDGKSCAGCDGVSNSKKVLDGCGVCAGSNTACMGCDGVLYGQREDACSVCGGQNDTCLVCDPGMFGVDACGVCGGDNSSCAWLSSWKAPVRVISAISLSGISAETLTVDTASEALATTLAAYLNCREDQLHLGTIVEKSSDARRRHSASVSSSTSATHHRVSRSRSTQEWRLASAPQLRVHGDEVLVVVGFYADVGGAAEARQGAARLVDAVETGELAEKLSQHLKTPVQVTLAKPPFFEKLVFEGGGEQKFRDTVSAEDDVTKAGGAPIVVAVVAYLVVAVGVACWSASVPEKVRRPPCTVFALWLVFGILGVHRFYTRTPRVGMLYFFTLGVCGLGWLSDLYWQRRFLFGTGAKSSGSDGVSGKDVVKRGKDLIKHSTFGETWRRKKDQRRNRHQRLDDDIEGSDEGRAGARRGGRLGRTGMRKGAARQGESCGEDNEDEDFENDIELHVVESPKFGAVAPEKAPAAQVERQGGEHVSASALHGVVQGVVVADTSTDDLDELTIHQPAANSTMPN